MFRNNKYRNNINSVQKQPSLGQIIQSFKSSVTRIVRFEIPGIKIWQRNFHDRNIRNESELEHYRQYIKIRKVKSKRPSNGGLCLSSEALAKEDFVFAQRLQRRRSDSVRSRPRMSRRWRDFSFRKEVIHEQLPLPVPCYDFVPIIEFTFGRPTTTFGCPRLS